MYQATLVTITLYVIRLKSRGIPQCEYLSKIWCVLESAGLVD
jgi:hypothetical protein